MQQAIHKAKKTRLLILDVDGVLTSGTLYYGNQTEEMKDFHIHDGLGIKLLQKTGVNVAIISGKTSEALKRRITELQIQNFYLNQENKIPSYEKLKTTLNLQDSEIAYMGDDYPDLPLLRRVGLAITVANAPALLQQHADFVTRNNGGKGAVREACEFIMQAQGQFHTVIQSYFS